MVTTCDAASWQRPISGPWVQCRAQTHRPCRDGHASADKEDGAQRHLDFPVLHRSDAARHSNTVTALHCTGVPRAHCQALPISISKWAGQWQMRACISTHASLVHVLCVDVVVVPLSADSGKLNERGAAATASVCAAFLNATSKLLQIANADRYAPQWRAHDRRCTAPCLSASIVRLSVPVSAHASWRAEWLTSWPPSQQSGGRSVLADGQSQRCCSACVLDTYGAASDCLRPTSHWPGKP